MKIFNAYEKYRNYLSEIFYLLGNSKKKLPLMVFVFIFSSFLDLAGIGLVVPYIAIILNPDGFHKSSFSPYFQNIGLSTKSEDVAISIGIALIAVFFIKGIFSFLVNKMIWKFSFDKVDELRSKLMRTFQNMPYDQYLKRNSSEYIHSILTLTSNFSLGTLQALLRLISEGIVMFSIFIILILTSGFELLLFISLIGVVFISFDILFRKRLMLAGRKTETESKNLIKSIYEAILGLKEIRVLGKESFFHQKLVRATGEMSNAQISATIINAIPRSMIELIIVIFIVSLVISGIMLKKNITDLAIVLGVFAAAAMRLIPSTNYIIASIAVLGQHRSAVNSLYKNLKDTEFIDTNNKNVEEIKYPSSFQTLAIKSVSYSYGGSRVDALSEINFSLSLGETIGIMGASGSGKSTLVHILLGFLKPEIGEVIFNGKILKEDNLDEWMGQVAYLPQNIFLIDDTFRRNIALGIDDHNIDDAKIQDAIDKSNLRELVNDLPEGINTLIGERGARLSGGQQQRIAIARAFYFGRNVLIMDEATSALDNKTENEIVEEIKNLKGRKAIILIAHRLSTLRYCDRIYRMERGRIVQVGSYDEVVNGQS